MGTRFESRRLAGALTVAAAAAMLAVPVLAGGSRAEAGGVFDPQGRDVQNLRYVDVPGHPVRVALWDAPSPSGDVVSYYAVSLDGTAFGRPRLARHTLELRYATFDPAVATPRVPPSLMAAAGSRLHIVQFVSQPLEAYREVLRAAGAEVLIYLANNAQIVKMPPAVAADVAQLPFVRWVGPFEPAYKFEDEILEQIRLGVAPEARRYSVMLFERGEPAQQRVIAAIADLGGVVHGNTPLGFRIEATLTLAQVRAIAALDDVLTIDRKGEVEVDMNNVRIVGGANYIESNLGFTGQGVRAEVADTELYLNHREWRVAPIVHRPGDSGVLHGTACYGILFAQGIDSNARGLIPDGVGIYANSAALLGGGQTRYDHTAELVDPAGNYRAVLQTNSTGDPRTRAYTSISAETDDILFINDILICQSQSNAGNQDSRPQAWSKNIVSVGGFYHQNNANSADDCWNCGPFTPASIGPAADNRIKPDLAHFYEDVHTTWSSNSYTEFSGTSAATPITAGHFGLFFQMWHEQVFAGFGGAPTVFESRPHMTTAKALMINTAYRYDWTQGGPNADLDRNKQGWGRADLAELYDYRDRMLIVDESDVLSEMGSTQYTVTVVPGEPVFRATMAYADPRGNPSSNVARINDLSLRVTSPDGDVFWGNNGLRQSNESTPGGVSNTVDTVENVFVVDPAAGDWLVEVLADEINEDAHVETPEVDADYALVVTGGLPVPPPFTMRLLRGPSGLLPAGTEGEVEVEIIPGLEEILPGSEKLYYRYDGGAFVEIPLTPIGGDRYTATMPAVGCSDTPEYYVSAEGDLGTMKTLPVNAPDSVYGFEVGEIVVLLSDNFETDTGWTVQSQNLSTGAWVRAVPSGGGLRGDPVSDYDGSGRCYVTGNGTDEDVDGGPTILTSPVLDMSDPNTHYVLNYARWFSTDDGNDFLVVDINNGGGWVNVETVGTGGGWVLQSIDVADYVTPTATVQMRFTTSDNPNDSVTEAGLDAFSISYFACDDILAGDTNCDGTIDGADIEPFFLAVGFPDDYVVQFPNCELLSADMNGDNAVDGADIDPFFDCLGNGNCP